MLRKLRTNMQLNDDDVMVILVKTGGAAQWEFVKKPSKNKAEHVTYERFCATEMTE